MLRLGALAAVGFMIMCASSGWADGIFEAHVKAVGGKDAIAKIKSIYRSGSMSGTSRYGPLSGTCEEIIDLSKRRGYSSLELVGYSRQVAWTGFEGWARDPQTGVTDMSMEEAAFASYGAEPSPIAAIVAAHGQDAVKVGGSKEFNEKDCVVVTIQGIPITFYVNQDTKLLEGYSGPGGYEFTYQDYKEIQGVQLPSRRTVKLQTQDLTLVYEFKTIRLNSKIDESKFERPGRPEANPKTPKEDGSSAADQIIVYLDKNGDRKISKDEASQELKDSFAYIDTNGDGVIDAKEAEAMLAYAGNGQTGSTKPAMKKPQRVTAKQLVDSMDKNSDGTITKDEASEDLKLFFGDIDTNGDGAIDIKEAEAMAKYVNEQAGISESDGSPAAPSGKVTARQMIAYMDKNSDGKITKDEASDELKQSFQYIDANGDGVIDIKEAQVMADYVNNQQKQ